MSARLVVSIAAWLLAGCAAIPKTPFSGAPSAPTPTCTAAADCDAKWAAARTFLLSHTSYKIQNDSVDRLETFNPSEVSDGLRANVSKLIQPDGSYAIEAKFWCNNLIECSPSADKTLEQFNRTVAAAAPATAGVATPSPVVQQPSAKITGSEQHSQRDAQKYIEDSEAAWAESVSTNDTSVVKRIMADDCVWVLDGRVLDKAHAVAEAAQGPGDFMSNHLDYAHLRFFGDIAIVQGSETWTRKNGKTGHFVWTDTWIQRNNQWQIVAAEDTIVPIAH